jgi:glycosyltransferase involved in cell wall biosynthesis
VRAITHGQTPAIWFDISDTMLWRRPISGIIRTQLEVSKGLRARYPNTVRFCAFFDQSFIPISQEEYETKVKALAAGDYSTEHYRYERDFPPRRRLAMRLYGAVLHRAPSSVRRVLQRLVRTAKALLRLCRTIARLARRARGRHTPLVVQAPEDHAIPTTFLQRPGDVYISMSADWAMSTKLRQMRAIKQSGVRTILTCYDLIPLLFPHLCLAQVAAAFPTYLRNLGPAADSIVCISRRTRADLEQFLQQSEIPLPEMPVVYLGTDHASLAIVRGAQPPSVSQPFILFVSTIERRKNHEVLYKAYVRLREADYAPPLCVFAGAAGWGVDALIDDITLDPRVKSDFMILNQISDGELQWLYEHCLFTVYPSLYEGWGLPVAESLRNGKFVLAANAASLPEVGSTFAEYLDPWDVAAWAERIRSYAQTPDLLKAREAAIAAQYRPILWEQTMLALDGIVRPRAKKPESPVVDGA